MRAHRLLLVVAIAGVSALVPWTLAVSLLPLGTGGLILDHYNEYDFEVHDDAGVLPFTLVDQWGESSHSFALYDRFLAPTEQDEDPINNPELFYTRYFIGQGGEPARPISVTNKFGEDQNWMIRESFALLNPSSKNDPTGEIPVANHYKCYIADGPFIGAPVVLSDQFGTYTVTVTEPAVWCNPAEKRLSDGQVFQVVDSAAWLACYFTNPPSFIDPPISVAIADQFGIAQKLLVSRELLCVPSEKALPVPTQQVSWGGIKTVYR